MSFGRREPSRAPNGVVEGVKEGVKGGEEGGVEGPDEGPAVGHLRDSAAHIHSVGHRPGGCGKGRAS